MGTENTVQNAQPATPKVAPKFVIEANSPRELALKVARAIFKTGQFDLRQTQPEKGTPSSYAVWNLDDSGKVSNSMMHGITLTMDEAKQFPTERGVPVLFSVNFALRQLTPLAAASAAINERHVQTAARDAASASKASDAALLAEYNKRRIAKGLEPVDEI